MATGMVYLDAQGNPVDESLYNDWRSWNASQSGDSPNFDDRFNNSPVGNWTARTQQQQLYADVASGKVKLSPDQFDTLFSNEDLGMSQFEFSQLPPEIQQQARSNPQLFMQSVLSNTSNKDHGDLLSIGAEGGYSDYQTAQWGAGGLTPDQSKYMQIQEEPNWGLYVMLAAMGGLAAAGMGAFGAAAQNAVMGIESAGAALGVAPEALSTMATTGGGSFVPSAATNGMLGVNALNVGAAAPLMSSELSTALAAGGLSAAEVGQILTMPAMAEMSAAGLSTSQILQQVATNPALQTAVKAVAPSALSKLVSGITGGSGSGGFDLGNMITGGANLAYQNKLSQEGIDFAKQTAEGGKFTPYSINSGMGRSYVDPATGEMVSELAPEWQGAQDTLLNSFEGNMQYASMDPMEASQYAYNMGSNLNAYQDEQNRLGLENRLLSQGMLGSTGGANQMRSLYDSMNQRDLGREAQSLQLGQGMLDSYQRRGLAAYQPAWNTQQQFASQIGQSGTLGGQQAAGNQWGLNQINDAYSDRTKMLSGAATSMANNPQMSSGINNIAGWGLNALGNYFGGGTTFTQDGNTWQNGTDLSQFNFDPNASFQYDGNTWSGGVDPSQFYMDY